MFQKISLKNLKISKAGLGLGFALLLPQWAGAAQVTGIDFKTEGDQSILTISGSEPLQFEKQESKDDKQVVINIPGAKLDDVVKKKLDTSAFTSRVIMISPYETPGDAGGVRVVLQLKEFAGADASADGNVVTVKVPNPPEGPPAAEASAPPLPEVAAPAAPVEPTVAAEKKSKSMIEEFTTSSENRKFTGKEITLQVRDTDLADVFRLIAEASGFNIILGDDVKGKITLSMIDVPWDQVLDTILHTQKLGAERNGNVLRVVTLANLTAEKTAELNARVASESAAPRVTEVFPINFANLDELSATLGKFVGTTTTGGAAAGTAAANTFVQADRRTNSLIIRDIPDNLKRMGKLIEVLDVQTPQVLIEAKIVEIDENFSRSLGGSLGLGGNGDAHTSFGSFVGGNPFDPMLGSPGVFPTGKEASSQTDSSASRLGWGLSNVSILGQKLTLNSILNLAESEKQIKIISSPRIVVLNKENATVVKGEPVLVPTTTIQNGSATLSQVAQDANLSLDVTPTVTNESSILLNLKVTRDTPDSGGQGIQKANMKTNVLVDSGSTLVLGGVYKENKTEKSDGFPILRKIPIVGWFFGSESKTTDKVELFFFITPRILNAKEAGLVGGPT